MDSTDRGAAGTAATPDGAELAWSVHGDRGPAILLLPGQATTHRSWLHVVPQLAAGHRVVVMDHRGIGQSTLGRAPEVGTRGFAADAVEVLDAAGVEAAHLYGHSMGGRVAQWMAVDAPERVASLTLVGSTPGDSRGPARAPEVSRALAGGDLEAMGPLFFTEDFLAAHPDVARDFFARDASVRARRVHYQVSTGHDAWEVLPRIDAPTLVVHGAADPVNLPEHGRLLAERIRGAELLELDGQRHCPHLESADCTAAVLAFVDGLC